MKKVSDTLMQTKPDELESFPLSLDHSDHIVRLTLKGYSKLAADHILHPEMRGHLEETLGDTIRKLNLAFNKAVLDKKHEEKVVQCARIYDTLLNLALNLIGFEKKIMGFSENEVKSSLSLLTSALKGLEALERSSTYNDDQNEASIAKAVVERTLTEMKTVMKVVYRPPGAMVAHIAEKIEKELDNKDVLGSFLRLSEQQIQNNVYYKLSMRGACKFGNDYALGLRFLRHVGFVQVTTNPSLAAVAYEDDPSMWEGYNGEDLCPDFKAIIKQHPELLNDPGKHGDEITAYATEVSIWRNLTVFRPIAVASNMVHGMISLQLNPFIADNYEESVNYALKFYLDAQEFLRLYDAWLLWGYSENVERGRPNIVFKVAGSSPASIDITRKLESLGIGTNNTVTFTVPQMVELILAKIEGRAEAVKKGIPLTTVYETNMGGRLDDHVREVQAEALVKKAIEKASDKDVALKNLAEELGAWDEVSQKKTLAEKIIVVSSRKYLRPLNKEQMIRFLAKHGVPYNSEERVKAYLETLENDIGYCGILVTKKVYEIFFSPQNKPKWILYLQARYDLAEEQAKEVLFGIDILPASKRHTKETLLTLAETNMTHTEFPNHQTAVLSACSEPSFKIENCLESILKPLDSAILQRLTRDTNDLKNEVNKFYEITKPQSEIMKKAKIPSVEQYGSGGILPSQWQSFGAVIKTMDEFSSSYETFKAKCISFVKKVSKEK
ncbi:hypothetical protein KEJ18_01125 [Candidatus Bathyarchaeota archaeon]|nr:hypothetical protein [Candidatus Bathyarchaeota archaeon]